MTPVRVCFVRLPLLTVSRRDESELHGAEDLFPSFTLPRFFNSRRFPFFLSFFLTQRLPHTLPGTVCHTLESRARTGPERRTTTRGRLGQLFGPFVDNNVKYNCLMRPTAGRRKKETKAKDACEATGDGSSLRSCRRQ